MECNNIRKHILFQITPVQFEKILIRTKNEIYIQAGKGLIQILELQPEDRKRMTAEEFLRGYSLIN